MDTTGATDPIADCPLRGILNRIGDTWSVLVMLELSRGHCHFNALTRMIEGISRRMLTVTLRALERDGLVTREVLPTSPPRVRYGLTGLGQSLLPAIAALHEWADEHQDEIGRARADYDCARIASDETAT